MSPDNKIDPGPLTAEELASLDIRHLGELANALKSQVRELTINSPETSRIISQAVQTALTRY